MVPHPLDYRFEQLPGSSSGTEQDSYIVHGRTHTAGYRCRAGRGDPVNYSEYSNSGYIWSSDIHSSASLTVSPDRAQHFNSDSVSLSCEGNSAEWRVMRSSSEERYPLDCTIWGTMNGSTCNINTDRTSDAVYWCESGSGEFSNAVNITVQDTCFRRPMRSESSNTDHVVNLNEAQCSEYSSPPHAGGSQDVMYSSIQLQSVGKKGEFSKQPAVCPSHQPQ
uniref:Ig-like domain-containing protein n=1 Tax=Sparus aurata TaxID=8175 RepID=A0A671TN96_SPAAU